MILCCGEALIDMLPRTSTLGEDAYAPYAGGAIFNTAIALGRLGVPTGFFTGLSDDMMGDILRDTLRKSGVDYSYCATLSRPTTVAFVKLVDGHATYAFYDENTAGRMITEAELPAVGDECEALHFGAISLIPEPCGSTYEALLAREHGSASSRSIRTSVRISSGTRTRISPASAAWPPWPTSSSSPTRTSPGSGWRATRRRWRATGCITAPGSSW